VEDALCQALREINGRKGGRLGSSLSSSRRAKKAV
jgi:hypothetical protein